MQLEGTLNLERKRVQRWVPIVAIVVPVFLFVAAATWFIRAFVAPPMVAIPAPMTMAAATLPDRHPPPAALQLSAPSASAAASPSSTGAIEPTSPRTLPMFATFAIAPPAASLRHAPAPTVEPEPNAASSPAESPGPAPAENTSSPTDALADLPKDRSDDIATAALDPSEPLAGPIPLPPQRRRVSALQPTGPVPLPRPRPETEASSADIDVERRTFSAHGAE